MRRHPFLLGTLITFVVLAVAVVMYGRLSAARQDSHVLAQPPARATDEAGAAGVVSLEGRTQIVKRDRDGNILWKANVGADLQYDKASGRLQGKDVECELIIDRETTLYVQAGAIQTARKPTVLQFSGGVSANTNATDASFRAQRAFWNTGSQTLRGVGDVRVYHRGFVARGRVLRVDMVARRAEVSGDASLTYEGRKGETGRAPEGTG